MCDGSDVFVGRHRERAAFEQLLTGPEQVLTLWGAPGIGKSEILEDFRRHADARGLTHRSIDLEGLARHSRGLVDELIDQLGRVFTEWAPERRLSRLFGGPVRRLERRRDQAVAGRSARLATQPISVAVTAHSSGVIRDANIEIAAAGDVDLRWVHQQYRSALARALVEEVVRAHDYGSGVLFIDTTEILRCLDETGRWGGRADGAAPVLARWFSAEVVAEIARAAPNLKIVLAGRDRLELPPDLAVAEPVEVAEWTVVETAEYLIRRGLTHSPVSARGIHRRCHGVPVWTAMVVDEIRAAVDRGRRIGDDWLDTLARDKPVAEWLPRKFLHRLAPQQQRLVTAAAVLRTVTLEAVEFLLAGEAASAPVEFDDLFTYSFIRRVRRIDGDSERVMHGLVRAAVLGFLAEDRPDHLDRLHERAAAYFASRRLRDEEWYHRLAAGDYTVAAAWQRALDLALHQYDIDRASRLLDLVMAPEQAARLHQRNPALLGRAELAGVTIAKLQDRLDDAAALLARARQRFDGPDHAPSRARAARASGELAVRQGDLVGAERFYQEAQDEYRLIGDVDGEASVMLALGDIELRGGRIGSSRHQFDEAYRRYRDRTNEHGQAAVRFSQGLLAVRTDDVNEAERCFAEAERLFTETGDRVALPYVLLAAAELAIRQQRWTRAHELLDRARHLATGNNDRLCLASISRADGDLAIQQGMVGPARDRYQQAMSLADEAGSRLGCADALFALGELYLLRDDVAAADRHLAAAVDAFAQLSEDLGRANALRAWGDVARRQGDPARAWERYESAVRMQEDLADRFGKARTLQSMARLAVQHNDLSRAAELYRRVEDLHQESGIGAPWADTAQTLAELRRIMDRRKGGAQ